jgi:hypothetical protein
VYEGEWCWDKKHGVGKLVYACGEYSLYEGVWKDDVRDGKGRCVYADGSVYDGEWKEGVRHGRGILTLLNGCVYDGAWEDDKKHGTGKYMYRDGGVYEGEWQHDERCTRGKFSEPNRISDQSVQCEDAEAADTGTDRGTEQTHDTNSDTGRNIHNTQGKETEAAGTGTDRGTVQAHDTNSETRRNIHNTQGTDRGTEQTYTRDTCPRGIHSNDANEECKDIRFKHANEQRKDIVSNDVNAREVAGRSTKIFAQTDALEIAGHSGAREFVDKTYMQQYASKVCQRICSGQKERDADKAYSEEGASIVHQRDTHSGHMEQDLQ